MTGRAPRSGRARRGLAIGVLTVWFVVMAVAIGSLMLAHTVPFSAPDDLATLRAGLGEWLDEEAPATVIHVIQDRCSCTDNLVQHLVTRGARTDLHERVLFVGEPGDRAARFEAAGFPVDAISREELGLRLGLEAAPVLLVATPSELLYAGGYFDLPAAVHARDERILDALDTGARPDALPVFGCAVDPALAAQTDPLGLR